MAMLANKSVIVTGGLGALARVVVSELAAQGARVAVLDRSARPDASRAEVVYDGVDLLQRKRHCKRPWKASLPNWAAYMADALSTLAPKRVASNLRS